MNLKVLPSMLTIFCLALVVMSTNANENATSDANISSGDGTSAMPITDAANNATITTVIIQTTKTSTTSELSVISTNTTSEPSVITTTTNGSSVINPVHMLGFSLSMVLVALALR